ncbi:MAG: hypothetical protein GX977_11870 [Firmicutes bacterium]|nr:hypothetical protein [Bacillota bacterium]
MLVDWDAWPGTERAKTPADTRTVLATQTRRLWTAIYQWVGARLPTLGTAEAGLLQR